MLQELQKNRDDAIAYCKTTLSEILDLWPRRDCILPIDSSERLSKYLSKEFDSIDLLNNLIEGVKDWRSAQFKDSHILIEITDSRGNIQRAVFILEGSANFLLKELKFQCPVCFGTGQNNDRPCKICEGVGWGAGKGRGNSKRQEVNGL